MAPLLRSLAVTGLLCASFLSDLVAARETSPRAIAAKREAAVNGWDKAKHGPDAAGHLERLAKGQASTVKNITFSNPEASQFWVDGTSIPLVDFDVGPSWSGLIPISSAANETRKLFFWFFPPGPEGSLDDLIFWTNGGPGCSSLEGSFQENGPFTWAVGQAVPTVNEYSWTNLSSMLFVEQPVGTGFSQGTPTARDENDVAAQLVGFMEQFLNIFSELKGKNLYLTGESYAGMYVPYIANYIYENPTALDLNLQGIWVSDPVLGWDVVQGQIPVVDFVHKYEHVFAFNQTFMAQLDAVAEKCNYAGYMDKYVTYPPAGLLPLPGKSVENDRGCDVWDKVFDEAVTINPAFNMYRIFDTWPVLWDVLGFPGSFPQTQVSPLYFDREDVKKAIHAPVNVSWEECSDGNVFVGRGDTSLPPAMTVLPNVIEKSNRSVIVHGLADFILLSDGARIVIQNMTWDGKQGFQTPIANDSFIVDGVGSLGNMHQERGLTYYEVALSGHMVPGFSPVAALQIMSYLMGFRATP
ncbi:alpha/beta-hydrolase [Artomyces pyxidatus]|uniref:Alpha/beta-hydrolase n=1 Tax=Artomyces pyxidatus TaxID=48021 RepID=A0ACB8SSH9_9AGAM|nr:alpha/beta-hydrolase [Artomyces pyxidatus]